MVRCPRGSTKPICWPGFFGLSKAPMSSLPAVDEVVGELAVEVLVRVGHKAEAVVRPLLERARGRPSAARSSSTSHRSAGGSAPVMFFT
jgi:hypothetical protein